MTPPILQVDRVSKRFGNVVALRNVSMSVAAGEVTCLLGDNGAGKSTLIQILAGVHRPTEGRYLVDGEPVDFGSPREALAQGIATVYQDLAMIPLLSIWRNFFLGAEPCVGAGPTRRLDVAYCERVVQESWDISAWPCAIRRSLSARCRAGSVRPSPSRGRFISALACSSSTSRRRRWA